MSEPTISIRNLSKCYSLGAISRETFVDELRHAWCRLRGKDPRQHLGRIGHPWAGVADEGNGLFWALQDVSFDVQPGEVMGIVGSNGAGKSTLLKLLTRITEPTSGEAVINGRVASLLEVGTGFHQELTGRENIYMNGTILGMKRREITSKFDAIVSFSEIEAFIDTPVKRYSSGMYVRLAFAVAAHLEPEILLVDEVLAVGDAAFQRKCIGKMGEVARAGRTILFVSHNMAAVQNLCQTAVLLDKGRLLEQGPAAAVLQTYLTDRQDGVDTVFKRERPPDNGEAYFQTVRMLSVDGMSCASVGMGQGMQIEAELAGGLETGSYALAFGFFDQMGMRISGLSSADTAALTVSLSPGTVRKVVCRIPSQNLLPGVFYISAVLQQANPRRVVDRIERAVSFEVIAGDVYQTGKIPKGPGILYFPCEWEVAARQEVK